MNENASDENTVTGKAMGNLMSVAVSAAILAGSAYIGTAALGKAVKGVKNATGSIKKNASQIAENMKTKKAMKAEIKNPSAETKYYRNIQNRTFNAPMSEMVQMDKQAANRTMISRERAKENLDVLNDDLFYTLGEKGNDAAAIQTSLLEDKGGGRLGGIVNEQKLDMKDIKSRPKAKAEKVVKNDELKGQLSMFDDNYGNADKQIALDKQRARKFTESIMPPRRSPGDILPSSPRTGNGGNNIFNPLVEPIADNRTASVFTGSDPVKPESKAHISKPGNRKVKRGRGTKISDFTDNLNNPYANINMDDYTKKGTIKKSVLNKRDVHQYIKPGSINYKDFNEPTIIGFDRKSVPGYRGDRIPSWVR